ncbi:hypothetical protein ACHWQZ_G000258 [Mnemiopsis leidyi]
MSVSVNNAESGSVTLYSSDNGDETVEKKLFALYQKCLKGQYTDSDGACKPCTEGVRDDNMNQLHGCQACKDPKPCPVEGTSCRALALGEVSRGGWTCEKCPGGTYPLENKCEPCPTGTAREKEDESDKCTKCNADNINNLYTPNQGFSKGPHLYVNNNTCDACAAGEGLINGTCEVCPEGHYSRSGACQPCPGGSYSQGTGNSQCTPCEIGKSQNDVGSTSCEPCLASKGEYTNKEGSVECQIVELGFKVVSKDGDDDTDEEGIDQEECPAGSFGNKESSNWDCQLCQASDGLYQPNPQKNTCIKVSPGNYVIQTDGDGVGATETAACEIGKYRGEEDTPFTQCLPCDWNEGYFQDLKGQSSCKEVADGNFIVLTAQTDDVFLATSSDSCQVGTARSTASGEEFFNSENEKKYTECRQCNWIEGEWQEKAGQAKCDKVPEGSVVESITATSIKACENGAARSERFYNAEEEKRYTECKKCDWSQGQWTDKQGQLECQIVEEGFVVSDVNANSTKPCPAGTARSSTSNNECRQCNWIEGEWQEEAGQAKCDKVPEGSVVAGVEATAIKPCENGTARSESFYNAEEEKRYTECKKCDWREGQWTNEMGQLKCKDVMEGHVVESEEATSIKICEAGSARGDQFYYTGPRKFTECKPCENGFYQDVPGKSTCKEVTPGYKSNEYRTGIEPCPNGTREVGGVCQSCIPAAGEYQDKEGKNYCERIKPGYEAREKNEVPELCRPGTISKNYKCVPCNADMGEYQDFEGGSFCKAVNPGFELDVDEEGNPAVDKMPVKCKVGHFSKGSAKKCTPCDRDKKEYQNDEGATYCKICARGKVLLGAAVCEGLGCKEEKLFNLALREEEFVFSETAAGETLIIPCDATSTNNTADKIYRYCIFDEENYLARWDTPNYGACPTAKTEKLNQLKVQTDILKSKEKLASMNDTELANSMKSLSSGMEDIIKDEEVNGTKTEVKLTSRDVKDVAGTLDSIKSVIELPNTQTGSNNANMTEEEKKEMKEATTALKTTMAKTIDKVAASGEDTLKTVDNEEKASILKSVEALANSMEGDDEPIVTTTLAVRTISMSASSSKTNRSKSAGSGGESDVEEKSDAEEKIDADEEEDEGIPLPVPEGMEASEAPKLSLSMNASGASVAVFSEGAKDMFPDPTTAIDEDDVGEEVDDDGEPVKKNRTLNSAVVSLEFKNVKTVNFDLKIKSNTSLDKEFRGKKKFERTCTFLNITTTQWSSKGCKTTVIGDPLDGNVKCTCNHNTSFAVLLSISDIVDKSQETATLVMFCINMTFLLLTFFAIAPFKKYRKKRLVLLQTQLVLSLIVANTGFMCLNKVKNSKVTLDMYGYPDLSLNMPCYVGVIIVQYLFLVVMAWMTCCGYTLYGKIVEAVKTFGKTDRFYFHKAVVICWFLPALLPTSAFLTSHMMNSQDSRTGVEIPYIQTTPGKNKTDCWVANPWKWVSFMIPMYLCLIINCSVFGMIVRVLIRASKSGSSGTGLGKQIKGAVTIAVTVGVPWIVGVLTFEPIALVGQWLFIILTGLQGPVMFVVFVILQDEVLGTLLRPFGVEVPEILKSARSGTSARKTSAAFTSVLSREKPFDPATIDPVAAKQIAEQKKLEDEARNNVYSNEGAINESEGSGSTGSNALLVKCEADESLPVAQVPTPLPTPEKAEPDQDHLYYECTHFPYDPDAVSLASHYPDPVTD